MKARVPDESWERMESLNSREVSDPRRIHRFPVARKILRFIAQIAFLDPSEGGRTMPVSQGYRPTIKLEGHEILFSGKIVFLDESGAPLAVGYQVPRPARAEILMSNSQLDDVEIKRGTHFRLTEGTRPIANGLIEAVMDAKDYDY